MKESLKEIASDPFNKIGGSQHGPQLISLAESLLENLGICDVIKLHKVLDKLWKTVTSGDKSKGSTNRCEKMWKAYHVLRSDPTFIGKVTTYLGSELLPVHCKTLFVQTLIRKLFEKIVRLKSMLPSIDSEDDFYKPTIPPIEENILRYAAGFVPFLLKKQCIKRESSSMELDENIKCLNCVGVSNEIDHPNAFLDYTKSWLRKQNRGGLFMLNDHGYRFFKAVECHCRKYFQKQYIKGGSDIRLLVVNAVMKDKVAIELWRKATVRRYSVVSVQVIKMCIKLWINIRGHAFAMNYIEQFKNLQTAEASKKKALRKDLKNMKLT